MRGHITWARQVPRNPLLFSAVNFSLKCFCVWGPWLKATVVFNCHGPYAAIAEHWAVILFKGITRAVLLIQVSEFMPRNVWGLGDMSVWVALKKRECAFSGLDDAVILNESQCSAVNNPLVPFIGSGVSWFYLTCAWLQQLLSCCVYPPPSPPYIK